MILQPNIESIYLCLYHIYMPAPNGGLLSLKCSAYDVVRLLEIDFLIENFLKNAAEKWDFWWIHCWQSIITVKVPQTQTVIEALKNITLLYCHFIFGDVTDLIKCILCVVQVSDSQRMISVLLSIKMHAKYCFSGIECYTCYLQGHNNTMCVLFESSGGFALFWISQIWPS